MIASTIKLKAIILSEANIITPQSQTVEKLTFLTRRLADYQI